MEAGTASYSPASPPLAHGHWLFPGKAVWNRQQSSGSPGHLPWSTPGKSEAAFVCKLIIKCFYSCRIPAHPAPWQQLYPPPWQQRCCSNSVHDSSGAEESQAEPPKRSKPRVESPPGSCSLMFPTLHCYFPTLFALIIF